MKRHRSNIILRRTIALVTATLLVSIQVLAAAFCFAEDYYYRSLREGTVTLEIPMDWSFAETGTVDDDVKLVEGGEYAYKVCELQNQDGAKQGELWFCTDPYDDSYYYPDSEESAEEYLESAGDDAIETVIETAFPDADNYTWENQVFLKSEDAFTYTIRHEANIDGKKHLIYLNCDFTTDGGVHEILFFSEPYDEKLCDRIGEHLEGYSYAYELIENKLDAGSGGDGGTDNTYYSDNESFRLSEFSSYFTGLIVIIIGIYAYRRVMKGRQKGGAVKPKHVKADADPFHTGSRTADPFRKRRRRTIDKWTLRETRKGECRHEDMHIRVATRYSGYRESLRTLHKSGLLTTKEMNELLEKHRNDF